MHNKVLNRVLLNLQKVYVDKHVHIRKIDVNPKESKHEDQSRSCFHVCAAAGCIGRLRWVGIMEWSANYVTSIWQIEATFA